MDYEDCIEAEMASGLDICKWERGYYCTEIGILLYSFWLRALLTDLILSMSNVDVPK